MKSGTSNVKNTVLTLLENNRGGYVSGAEIAKTLGVSRNAVWKAMVSLKEEGYDIESSKPFGYRLSENSNVLSKQSVEKYLENKVFNIEVEKTVTSTNTVLRERAEKGMPEWTVLAAEEQTAGKGRMSRSFFSPSGTGIYMSILLRPDLPAAQSVMITTCAAVAVAKAVERVCGIPAGIKWVNDVFCGDKKVCGILTEASLSAESGYLSYAVLGIGINVFTPDGGFPEELNAVAAELFKGKNGNGDIRSRLIAKTLDEFYYYYNRIKERAHFDEYKKRMFIFGLPVKVICGSVSYDAVARDIDDDFRLKVELPNGEIKFLDSGEVSVKKRDN